MNNRRSFVSFLCVSLILSALLSFNYAFIYSTFRGNVGLTQKLGSSVREEIFEEFRVSITDISHWYERRNLPRVRYVVENTLYPLLLQYSNDELQQNEAQVALNMMFELLQRWAFNYCIQITLSLFPNSKTTTSTHFLRNLDTYLVNLARQGLVTADTVNILLSDAVCRSNIRRADYIFELFFISSTSRTGRDSDYVELGLVFPTVRSINIMMEAHRRYVESSTNAQVLRAKKPWINRSSKISSDREDYFETVIGGFEIPRDYSMVWFYYSLFESYDENLSSRLRPDCYTLSTLVRISSQPGEIVSLLTQNPSVVTSPVLRCAIESLGNLGDPSAALLLYLRHCQHQKLSNGSYFSTFPVGRKTGDAIITALLSCPNQRLNSTTAYKEFCGKLSAEVAMELLFDGQCNESKYGIRCSSKGYTLLYTHIQRSLRRLSEPFSYSSEGNGHADDIDRAVLQRLRLEVAANFRKSRDRLFECMKKEIVAEISSTVGNRTAGPVSDDENPAVELNSRLIDALVKFISSFLYFLTYLLLKSTFLLLSGSKLPMRRH